MSYQIKDYSIQQAKKLNVKILPSTLKNKKIDVYKDNKKIASIGDIRFHDYPTYILNNGVAYANERRKLYKIRHNKDLKIKNSNGFYANKLLW